MKEKNILQGIGLAVLATFIWSGNFIVARAVYKEIPPVTLSFFRWVCATVVLIPFVWKIFRAEFPIVRQHLHYFFWLSLTGVALFNTFVYVAGHHTSAINLALIGTTSSPIMANILARVFLKEKIGWNKIIGILLCVAGILFLLSRGSWARLAAFHFSEGDAWVLLAAFCFAVYNTMVKKRPAQLTPMNFLFTTFLFGTLLLVPMYVWESADHVTVSWSWKMAGVIVYLGIGASAICFFIWNKSIQILGAGRTALFGNLIPVFSSLEAIIILKEEFTIYHVVSMLMVAAGLLIANLSLKKIVGSP